jgi:hypothetical protein
MQQIRVLNRFAFRNRTHAVIPPSAAVVNEHDPQPVTRRCSDSRYTKWTGRIGTPANAPLPAEE